MKNEFVVAFFFAAFIPLSSKLWSQVPSPESPSDQNKILKLFLDEFVLLTPGQGKYPKSFLMGSDLGRRKNEQPAHQVTFTKDFALGQFEVTQELYALVMGNNPAKWKGKRNSVEMVNWHEAMDFCDKVTLDLRKKKLIEDTETIRLPSEADWEYACRAGTNTAYFFGDKVEELGKYCWYKDNAPGNDPPVGKKKPNAWGLFDMHGYVWEWCSDGAHPDYKNAPADGSSWLMPNSKERMIRGGSYADSADEVRSAYRRAVPSDFRSDTIGFRCVKAKD
jgi:formylglycine-generating enzyme required for sulfatase activity